MNRAMLSAPPSWIRWVLLLPLALLTLGAAQILFTTAYMMAIRRILAEAYFGELLPSWAYWAAKCIAAPFMAGAFVGVVTWCAPVRKRLISRIALGLVAIWGTTFIVSGLLTPGVHHWLVTLGLCCLSGGLISWAIIRQLDTK